MNIISHKVTIPGFSEPVAVEIDESGVVIVTGAKKVHVKTEASHRDSSRPPLQCVVAVEKTLDQTVEASLSFPDVPGMRSPSLVGTGAPKLTALCGPHDRKFAVIMSAKERGVSIERCIVLPDVVPQVRITPPDCRFA